MKTIQSNKFDKAVENKTNRLIMLVILALLVIMVLSIKAYSQPKTAYLVTVNHGWKQLELYKADSSRVDSIASDVFGEALRPIRIMDSSQFLRLETENVVLYIERKEEREDGSLRRRKYKPIKSN